MPSVAPSSMIATDDESDDENDQLVHSYFGLQPDELVLKEYGCSKKILVKVAGRLLVTQYSLCFHSKTHLVSTKKEILLLKEIEKVEKEKDTLRVTTNKGKVHKYGLEKGTVDEAFDVVLRLTKKITTGGSNSGVALTFASFFGGAFTKEVLQPSDWEKLLKPPRPFGRDEVITQEGHTYHKLFRIAKGSCRVEKNPPERSQKNASTEENEPVVLGTMDTGELFGDIGFLERCPASATVIANEDEVEINVFTTEELALLFEHQRGFASRLYLQLAVGLAHRLSKREKVVYQRFPPGVARFMRPSMDRK